jgi:predicted short-subunit dehydrogenase-like oxidoreductase (DUF2520 family)
LATQSLQTAFAAIGAQPFALAAEHKVLYHAAAVFATNFLPVLQVVAADLWRSTGVPQALIGPLSVSLLRNAVQNITEQGAVRALTGPAARGDTAVVTVQGKAVADWNTDAGRMPSSADAACPAPINCTADSALAGDVVSTS